MEQSAFSSLNNSRLVRLLSDLNVSGIKTSYANFAEKFGQMFHFSSAVTLSRALENDSGIGFKPAEIQGSEVRDVFFSGQAELVRFIAAGFVPSSRHSDDPLPAPASLHAYYEMTGVFSAKQKGKAKKQETAYEPYRKFYTNRQSGIDIKVQHLRSEIRELISGFSPALAQLARIDKALFTSLSDASSETFAVIPKFLEKHFIHLFHAHRPGLPENPGVKDLEQWMKPGGWIFVFCSAMQELLLAELEVRLQPVVGMIESLPK
jgi:hypothetical protein